MKKLLLIFCFATGLTQAARAQFNIISTVAGNGTAGYSGDGGNALEASLNFTNSICVGYDGSMYITDMYNNVVRKITTAGIISTVAGNGTSGYSGDGGAATAAKMSYPSGVALDTAGNMYIADLSNSCIRKVSAGGIISTIAGDGTAGFSGDGGLATAAKLSQPTGVAIDASGNLYVCDRLNNRIRKIDNTGIITTVAGNGIPGFSGDGGPATAAKLNAPQNVALDTAGNMYISDFENSRIRKVTPSGIISTIVGTGTYGFSGDGGPAVYAQIGTYWGSVYPDKSGNIFIADRYNQRIRKINSSGIISTVAGSGVAGYDGDGGPAGLAKLNGPISFTIDQANDVYICDQSNNVIRKMRVHPDFESDSMLILIDKKCSGPELTIATRNYHPALNQTTYFGDGAQETTVILPGTTAISAGYCHVTHDYALPGTYSLRTVLRNGTTIIDSVNYYYQHKLCNVLYNRMYMDNNLDHEYTDGYDLPMFYPVTVAIDSNGVTVDTIATLGGFYYKAYGAIGDIYRAKVIDHPTYYIPDTTNGSYQKDTLESIIYNNKINNFGFNILPSAPRNYRIHNTTRSRLTDYRSIMLVDNMYYPSSATLTYGLGTKYQYSSATEPPTATTSNVVNWNISGLSFMTTPKVIIVNGIPATTLTLGDTVQTSGIIISTATDIDTTDNIVDNVDTVIGSYDPNFIDVSPGPYIPAGTKLEYTVGFENTGNDTAFNIYVLDTLSDDLDPATLTPISASANMDIFTYTAGGHTIVKFDFPHINLPDSSHHDHCHGLFVYTIRARAGLPDCTYIPARVGIYFDVNPVVMTNEVNNIIGPPPVMATITGANSLCVGDAITMSASIPGGVWSTSNSNASVTAAGVVTGNAGGGVLLYYTTPGACGPVRAQYLMTVGAMNAGFVLGSPEVCLGSSISLNSTVSGGVWTNYGAHTSLAGNVLSGTTPGIDTVYYTVTSACGSSTVATVISVDTILHPAVTEGPAAVCEGYSISLSNPRPGGVWTVCNGRVSVSTTGIVTGMIPGTDSVNYILSNGCGDFSSVKSMLVQPASACWPIEVKDVEVNKQILIYPNPATDELNITLDKNSYNAYVVMDNVGKTIILADLTSNKTTLSLVNLPPGIYYLRFFGQGNCEVRSFVKN